MSEQFGGAGRRREKSQATRINRPERTEEVDVTRRKLVLAAGALATLAAAGAAGALRGVPGRGRESEKSEKRAVGTESASGHIETREDPLAQYTFLEGETDDAESYDAGALTGMKFSDLYAAYLGVPDGTTMPETFETDFKANLASLWRMKFGFDSPKRTLEEECAFREKFLSEHEDLMDLAERLYRSYDPDTTRHVTLPEYLEEVGQVIHDAHSKLMSALNALRENPVFPRERRSIIARMVAGIDADSLLSITLTELMPGHNGELNKEMYGFILSRAGEGFIDRIPTIADRLTVAFGPYQFTPSVFESGAGELSDDIERQLPKNYLLKTTEDLQEKMQHRMGYFFSVEHITELTGRFSPDEMRQVSERIAATPHETLRKEVMAFVAMAHNLPREAYEQFKRFWLGRAAHSVEEVVAEVDNAGLREYVHKALKNYAALSTTNQTMAT